MVGAARDQECGAAALTIWLSANATQPVTAPGPIDQAVARLLASSLYGVAVEEGD
jgi:hypothetical protein